MFIHIIPILLSVFLSYSFTLSTYSYTLFNCLILSYKHSERGPLSLFSFFQSNCMQYFEFPYSSIHLCVEAATASVSNFQVVSFPYKILFFSFFHGINEVGRAAKLPLKFHLLHLNIYARMYLPVVSRQLKCAGGKRTSNQQAKTTQVLWEFVLPLL